MTYRRRPPTSSRVPRHRIPWAATLFTAFALAAGGSLLVWRSAPKDVAHHLRSSGLALAGPRVNEAPKAPPVAPAVADRAPILTSVGPVSPYFRQQPSARPGAPSEPATADTKPPTVPAEQLGDDRPAPTRGMLMVYMRGGTCQFELDGAPAGSGSSFQQEVPVGTHQVVCNRQGIKRIKSVTVDGITSSVVRFTAQ